MLPFRFASLTLRHLKTQFEFESEFSVFFLPQLHNGAVDGDNAWKLHGSYSKPFTSSLSGGCPLSYPNLLLLEGIRSKSGFSEPLETAMQM